MLQSIESGCILVVMLRFLFNSSILCSICWNNSDVATLQREKASHDLPLHASCLLTSNNPNKKYSFTAWCGWVGEISAPVHIRTVPALVIHTLFHALINIQILKHVPGTQLKIPGQILLTSWLPSAQMQSMGALLFPGTFESQDLATQVSAVDDSFQAKLFFSLCSSLFSCTKWGSYSAVGV